MVVCGQSDQHRIKTLSLVMWLNESDGDGRLHYMAEGGLDLVRVFGLVAGDGFEPPTPRRHVISTECKTQFPKNA